jgi:hypothetical protein
MDKEKQDQLCKKNCTYYQNLSPQPTENFFIYQSMFPSIISRSNSWDACPSIHLLPPWAVPRPYVHNWKRSPPSRSFPRDLRRPLHCAIATWPAAPTPMRLVALRPPTSGTFPPSPNLSDVTPPPGTCRPSATTTPVGGAPPPCRPPTHCRPPSVDSSHPEPSSLRSETNVAPKSGNPGTLTVAVGRPPRSPCPVATSPPATPPTQPPTPTEPGRLKDKHSINRLRRSKSFTIIQPFWKDTHT